MDIRQRRISVLHKIVFKDNYPYSLYIRRLKLSHNCFRSTVLPFPAHSLIHVSLIWRKILQNYNFVKIRQLLTREVFKNGIITTLGLMLKNLIWPAVILNVTKLSVTNSFARLLKIHEIRGVSQNNGYQLYVSATCYMSAVRQLTDLKYANALCWMYTFFCFYCL